MENRFAVPREFVCSLAGDPVSIIHEGDDLLWVYAEFSVDLTELFRILFDDCVKSDVLSAGNSLPSFIRG